MDYTLSIPACCRASGNRNWEDAGMSFRRDSGITGNALLIKSMRRRTTVYRRVTFAGIGQFPESTSPACRQRPLSRSRTVIAPTDC
jgi:hypothetical protein